MRFYTTLFLFLASTMLFAQRKTKYFSSANDPAWAEKVVWYQIFPERFANGDTKNDPVLADILGSYPHDSVSELQTHPWTSDWYELQPYELRNGKNFWYNVQRRRYGGDLQGIINKLDYLDDLGINAIYLNPIFMAPSSHKYDASCLHHVDPTFGPDPLGDRLTMLTEQPEQPKTWVFTKADLLFLKLIRECHRRKIYLIIDGVFNHIGINSFAFRDVEKNQEASKFKDWFTINNFENKEKDMKLSYKGWFDIKELPEFKRDEVMGLAKGPRDYIFAVTKRWMDPDGDGDPSDGVDGWRLDVAFCINHSFWKAWHKVVRGINPSAYTVAEVVKVPELEKAYIAPDEFSATMNYNWMTACNEFFIQDQKRIKASIFDHLLLSMRYLMGEKATPKMLNLLGSHDTNRMLSAIANKDGEQVRNWGAYFNWSQVEKNILYNIRKPTQADRVTQKLMAIFQMTYTGAPMIYYGDEVCLWGANDPDCRKPMLWADKNYTNEFKNPDQSYRERPDKVYADESMLSFYRRLIKFRLAHEALTLGNFKMVLIEDEKQLYGYSRTYKDEAIYIVLNNNSAPQVATVKLPKNQTYWDLVSGETYETQYETRQFTIAAKNGIVLIRQIVPEKEEKGKAGTKK